MMMKIPKTDAANSCFGFYEITDYCQTPANNKIQISPIMDNYVEWLDMNVFWTDLNLNVCLTESLFPK
jgi:hypothetical protein